MKKVQYSQYTSLTVHQSECKFNRMRPDGTSLQDPDTELKLLEILLEAPLYVQCLKTVFTSVYSALPTNYLLDIVRVEAHGRLPVTIYVPQL